MCVYMSAQEWVYVHMCCVCMCRREANFFIFFDHTHLLYLFANYLRQGLFTESRVHTFSENKTKQKTCLKEKIPKYIATVADGVCLSLPFPHPCPRLSYVCAEIWTRSSCCTSGASWPEPSPSRDSFYFNEQVSGIGGDLVPSPIFVQAVNGKPGMRPSWSWMTNWKSKSCLWKRKWKRSVEILQVQELRSPRGGAKEEVRIQQLFVCFFADRLSSIRAYERMPVVSTGRPIEKNQGSARRHVKADAQVK